ncbi:MAG: hypothetical protein LBT81_04865 [Helicobacteraceae bacterium]|jgi:hypothetical protein|nr:hypothetical protein [Helicobacteraceae bacterium]
MRAASLAEIVRGRLLADCDLEISCNFRFDADLILRADCFFHFDGNEGALAQAIVRGAFAIVFCGAIQAALDTEIAYIQCDDPIRALAGVLRFLTLENRLKVFSCDPVSYMIAKKLIAPKGFCAADSLQTAIEEFNSNSVLLCVKGSVIDESAASFPMEQVQAACAQYSVFESVIFLNSKIEYFELPSLFADRLQSVVAFADKHKLSISANRRIEIENFQIFPIFSDRYVILDSLGIENEVVRFFSRNMAWLKLYIPPKIPAFVLAEGLKSTLYNFAYVSSVSKEDLLASAARIIPQSASLF